MRSEARPARFFPFFAEPHRSRINQLDVRSAESGSRRWRQRPPRRVATDGLLAMLRCLVYLLAAAALVHARATVYLNARCHAAAPVDASARDVHSVLTHHFGLDPAQLRGFEPAPTTDSRTLWHHLPADPAAYDAAALLEPDARRPGGVLVFVHGADAHGVVPDSLHPTHALPSASEPSTSAFDALARLYSAAASSGPARKLEETVRHWWNAMRPAPAEPAQSAGADPQALVREEAAKLHALAQPDRAADSFRSVRLEALAALEEAAPHIDAKVLADAKRTLRNALDALSRNSDRALALVHTDAPRASRLAARDALGNMSEEALLQAFTGGGAPHPGAPLAQQGAAAPSGRQLAPAEIARSCFQNAQELERASGNCSGHGHAVQTTQGGRKCFRCACTATKARGGATMRWAGAACEKVDYSQQTLLLGGTIAFLLVSTLTSIVFLYREGERPLPGTLASISTPK